MRIGAALFLIAVGAILKFAITKTFNGIDLNVIGVILMVIGAIGLLIELVLLTMRRRTDVIHHPTGTTYVTPQEPTDRNYY